MQRDLYKRLYDTFDVGTYRKSPEKRMAKTDCEWAKSPPRKSAFKEKKLQEQIKHERYMREMAKKELLRRTVSPP